MQVRAVAERLPVPMQNTMLHHVDHYFGGHAELLNMHERLADLLLLAQGLSSQDEAGKILQSCTS